MEQIAYHVKLDHDQAKNLRNQTVTRVYPAVFITASLGGLSFWHSATDCCWPISGWKSRVRFCFCWRCLRFCSSCGIGFQLSFGPGGKKLIGATGLFCQQAHFIFFEGFSEGFGTQFSVGVVFFGIGTAMSFSNWFALLHPLIPQIRGSFFSRLILTWQGFSFFFPSCILSPRTEPGPRSLSLGARVSGVVSDGPDSNFLEHS